MRNDVTVSDRGFKHMDPIYMHYPSKTEVKIYESSSVEPAIWIAVEQDAIVGDEEDQVTHAHLTMDEAKLLRDQLAWLIDNHWSVK